MNTPVATIRQLAIGNRPTGTLSDKAIHQNYLYRKNQAEARKTWSKRKQNSYPHTTQA